MPTAVKQRPKVQRKGGKRRKVQVAPPRRRMGQRVGYWLRHPINALWGWLSSVRTAILLILSIVVICFLGIYFPQAPGEVLNDPTAYTGWVQQKALPQYGSLTPVFNWLQFFTIFQSWYFLLLLTILALSIVVCTLNRFPSIWQNFRHPILRRSEKFYENALERAEFRRSDAETWTVAALRKRGFRVKRVVDEEKSSEDQSPETIYLYAYKHTWATLSTFFFHAALVTLLMIGVVSQWRGFAADSPARTILPAPLLNFSDTLAGFTFDQALANGQSAVVYPRGTPHNISFRVNHFSATFDAKTGMATDYVTDLSVYQDGLLVARSNHLRVNDPLAYGGVVFHQSSLIPSVNVTISDASGCLVCNEPIILDQTLTLPSGRIVDLANGVPIAGTDQTLSVLFIHQANENMAQLHNPMLLMAIGQPGTTPDANAAVRLQAGQSSLIHGNWTIRLNSASEATVLLVTKDTGAPLIWPTAVILILSLCVTFYFPQRRIWLRLRGEHVQMAALREHFVIIRTDLLAIQRASDALSSPKQARNNV